MKKSPLMLIAIALACTLAVAVPTMAPAATPADPQDSVVLIATRTPYGEAAGSGMVLTSTGQVLTNYHVVKGSTAIEVEVPSSGTVYSATVLGHDASRDVALLQLQDASGLAVVTPDEDAVDVGDTLTAIGNASGGGELVAASGTVTALDQQVTVNDDTGGTETLTGVIQTTAAAVPGDSGGPMFDSEGEVAGMTTAGSQTVTRGPRGGLGARSQTAVTTTSFAVPIADALAVVEQIRAGDESGTVQVGPNAYLGITVATTSATSAVVVTSVVGDGPAAAAGVTAGSVITSIDGTTARSQDTLADALAGLEPGQQVGLTWVDATGTPHTGTVTLGESPLN